MTLSAISVTAIKGFLLHPEKRQVFIVFVVFCQCFLMEQMHASTLGRLRKRFSITVQAADHAIGQCNDVLLCIPC